MGPRAANAPKVHEAKEGDSHADLDAWPGDLVVLRFNDGLVLAGPVHTDGSTSLADME